ncbi:MAG: transcriptional regulator [Sphingobacteriales bacterium 40-81]|nr:MAG: transcriptional regulator [Sphingobacteriales bacterium 40-81]
MDNDLEYKLIKSDKSLDDFVESFWLLQNHSDNNKNIIVLPDGRIDLVFYKSATKPFKITLIGLGTKYEQATITPKHLAYAISFKPLATEYIFHEKIADLLDAAKNLPTDFWNFSASDLNNFDDFCKKATEKLHSLLPNKIDNRKRNLFDLIYSSNGIFTVQELSEKVFWSSRQINRYFNQQFGLSLKAYCNILRFRASFQHIKEGKLFPQQNFADQSHFIKEIKKLSGVSPKELKRNQNDRFIQFSTLTSK